MVVSKRSLITKVLLVLFIFSTANIIVAQNKHEQMLIEPLDDSEAYDVSGGNCVPGNIVITIKSNLSKLVFDSNVEDIEQPVYDKQKQEYVFCHSNESFYLNVSCDGYISKEITIDATKPKYGFKIISALPKGKVLIKTTPKNALIDFGLSGIAPQVTGETPFELNVGKYKTKIFKDGYSTVSMEVEVLSDGTVNVIEVMMKPLFSKIQFNVTTSDRSRFSVLPVINIDTAFINLSDLYDITKLKSFNNPGKLEYYKMHENGFVALPEGQHDIIINAPGYKTFFQKIFTVSGATTPLNVILEPVSGYLTVIDDKNANGADVIINNEKVGTVPFFKLNTKIGEHKVRFLKSGYMTDKEYYRVFVSEDSITDLHISMSIYKEINVLTNPQGAEIFVNNERQGFTPSKIILKQGKNNVTIKKTGYYTFNQSFDIQEGSLLMPNDLNVTLRMNYPLTINTEDVARAVITEKGIEIASLSAPGTVEIPYGKYKLQLFQENKRRFSGRINHNGRNKVNAPLHSWGTFTTLVADYYTKQNSLDSYINNQNQQVFSMMGKGQFGRFNVFIPGLSTALLYASVFKVNEPFVKKSVTINNTTTIISDLYAFSGSCMFLNGEFRTGGSIMKNIDFNLIGSYVWYPSLTKYIAFNHISGTEYFYGVEFGTRLSTLNMNVKFGKKVLTGNYNIYGSTNPSTLEIKYTNIPLTFDNYVFSVGFTLGRKASKSNNMFRLWKKPVFAFY